MKRVTLFLIILVLSLFLAACKPYDDLSDMRCDACGGKYHYQTTVNSLGYTYYHYVCDICGREIRTRIWRGK